jgi:predicted peroxiredoxin
MAALLFVITHSTDDPDRAATAIRTALAAQERGHDVHLWLSGEGVRLGVRAVAETLREPGPPTAAALDALARGGATFHLDRPSFERRRFEATALRPAAVVAEPSALADLVAAGRAAVPT